MIGILKQEYRNTTTHTNRWHQNYQYHAGSHLLKKRWGGFIVLLFFYCTVNGQGADRFWMFGHQNGLDFATSPPTFFQSNMESVEGCAVISDASGNLLFYSNGNEIWNAAGNIMPNGSGILGNGPSYAGLPGSAAQGVIIVQHPGNDDQYYLFTLDATEDISSLYPGYLRYSIIDMSLNAGLGDVLSGYKNIIIDSTLTELMAVTKGHGCYAWLLTHKRDTNEYIAYKIDASGINLPVSSTGTWIGTTGGGEMKISPDGSKVALGIGFSNLLPDGFEIGSFNNGTGMVSNTIFLDTIPSSGYPRYGFCFSPDNNKLYVTAEVGGLAQYDLSAFPNAASVLSSKTVIDNTLFYYGLRNGKDGKIYVARNYEPYIGVINSPNTAGSACNFDPMALSQPAWAPFPGMVNVYGYGFGSDIISGFNRDTIPGTINDTVICATDDSIMLPAPSGFEEYIWNDGSTGSAKYIHTGGTYWVSCYHNCEVQIDTIRVTMVNLSFDLGADTILCPGTTIVMDASLEGASYLWQNGTTAQTCNATQEGTYFVTVTKGSCSASDTINISLLTPFINIGEADTLICEGAQLTLHAHTFPEAEMVWNTGAVGSTTEVNQAGLYIIHSDNICGRLYDSVQVIYEDCSCLKFIPNAFSPNGDNINDQFIIQPNCLYQNFMLRIYNRFGECVYYTADPDAGWNGYYKNRPCEAGTYFYFIQLKDMQENKYSKKGDLQLVR